MKVKLSFVTNSSSTSYIVFIPNTFKPSPDDIIDTYSHRLDGGWFEECNEDEIVKKVLEKIEDLKCGEIIYEYDTYEEYAIISDLCNHHDFILASVDISSDGNGTITNVKREKILEILVNHDNLDDVMKPFLKTEECNEIKN